MLLRPAAIAIMLDSRLGPVLVRWTPVSHSAVWGPRADSYTLADLPRAGNWQPIGSRRHFYAWPTYPVRVERSSDSSAFFTTNT
jgi:hypothetical protein